MSHPLFENILVGNGYTDVEGREITYIDYYKPVPQELVADYSETYNINTDCHNACLGCQIGQLDKYPNRTTWKIKTSNSFLYKDGALTKKILPLKKHQHVDIIERKGELFKVSVNRYIATCMRFPKEHKRLASMSKRSFTERRCDECESEFTVEARQAKGWVRKSDLTGFLIQCDFIPREYELPQDYKDALTEEQRKFAIASMDPSMWAQKFLARTLRPHQEVANRCTAKYKVLRWGRRSGKPLALDTPVPTPNGWKTMADIDVGDVVFDEDGKPTRVVFATDPMYGKDCFEIKFDDGETITSDAEHLWSVETRSSRRIAKKNNSIPRQKLLTTAEMIDSVKIHKDFNYSIPLGGPLDFPKQELLLDPYVLGYWLGDGVKGTSRITIGLEDQIESLSRFEELGFQIRNGGKNDPTDHCLRGLLTSLKELGVAYRKRIPESYALSSFEDRLALFQGLMDSDGSINPDGSCEFTSSFPDLADDVYRLACSLGIKVSKSTSESWFNGKQYRDRTRFYFRTTLSVFKLQRKAELLPKEELPRRLRRRIVSINPTTSVPVKCIGVENKSHLFLVGDACIPTHNTYGMAMNMLNFLFNVQFPDGTDAQGEKKYRGGSVLILSPFLSQIELIFDNLIELLQRNDDLFAMKSRHVKTPYHRLEIDLGDGKTAVVKGFTTGAQSKQEASTVRGQSSDLIYADEVDYIPTNDLKKAIEPILLTYPHVKMWSSSTPSGKREWFYKECKESPHTKEFYFPSTVLDNWDDIKNTIDMTHDAFMQEYMGDFIAQMMGVYQPQYVGNAEVNYNYGESNFQWDGRSLNLSRPMPGWVYSIGVDWNSNAGTEIVVTGQDEAGRVFVVDAINIPKQNWMMIKAEQKIFELHKHWNPQFIYVDAGYGVGQIEHMQAASRHAKVTRPNSPDAYIEDKLVSYDFSKKIEFRDPNTGTMKKALAKPFLVENSIRQFENGLIFFPYTDKTLHNQLLNYIKENVSITGIPRYGQNDKKIGDHRVDALNLALVAYKLEMSSFAVHSPAATGIAKLASFGGDYQTSTIKQGDRILTEVRQNVPLQPDGNPAVGYSGLAVRYDPEYLKMVEAEKVLERSGEVRSRSRAIEKKPRESVTGKVTTLRPGIENDTEWKFKLQQRFSRAGARVMKRSSSKPTRRKV